MMTMTVAEHGGVARRSLGGQMAVVRIENIGAPFTPAVDACGALLTLNDACDSRRNRA